MPEFVYKRPVEELAPLKPLVTVLLLFVCMWALAASSGNNGVLSMQQLAFSGYRFAGFMAQHDYVRLLTMMVSATFSQSAFSQHDLLHSGLSVAQTVFNMYFIWVFGSLVEIRLGHFRYLTILILSVLAGWYALGCEVGATSTVFFVGPVFLTAGILGAYLNFLPEKQIDPGGNIGRSYKVITRESITDPSKSFTVSPWKLLVLFVVWQVILHFTFAGISAGFDNVRPLSALAATVVGLIVSVILIMIATPTAEGHPLQRLALLRYHELRKIDLTHDQAITGTARLLSLPDDTVRVWLQSAKSSLPTPPKN